MLFRSGSSARARNRSTPSRGPSPCNASAETCQIGSSTVALGVMTSTVPPRPDLIPKCGDGSGFSTVMPRRSSSFARVLKTLSAVVCAQASTTDLKSDQGGSSSPAPATASNLASSFSEASVSVSPSHALPSDKRLPRLPSLSAPANVPTTTSQPKGVIPRNGAKEDGAPWLVALPSTARRKFVRPSAWS